MNLPDFLEKTNHYLSRIFKPFSKTTHNFRQKIRLCWYSATGRLVVVPKRNVPNGPSSNKLYNSLALPANLLVKLPTNIRKIGVHGHAGAGKDTLLHGIMLGIEESGKYTTEHIKFADSIYRVCWNFFGDAPGTSYDRETKNKIDPVLQISRRRFLQLLGNDFAKKYMGSDVWARIYKDKTDKKISKNGRCVICTSDVRFPCEIPAIKRGDDVIQEDDVGIVIEVVRPDLKWDPCFLHSSELPISVEDVTLTVLNNGTEEDLVQAGKNLGRFLVKTSPPSTTSKVAHAKNLTKVGLN